MYYMYYIYIYIYYIHTQTYTYIINICIYFICIYPLQKTHYTNSKQSAIVSN